MATYKCNRCEITRNDLTKSLPLYTPIRCKPNSLFSSSASHSSHAWVKISNNND